jgi:hypothetical protein
MSRITHTQKRGKHTRNKRGGKQSQEKIKIKQKLGIFHRTPDSYDPKSRGLKFYYTALLDIYNTFWKGLNLNDKKKLIKDIIGDRGYLAKLRHPLRTRVYNNLVTDLENLRLMNEELGRDVVLGDFSGKTLKTVNSRKGEKAITCRYFNFNYCPSCSKLADFYKISSSKINHHALSDAEIRAIELIESIYRNHGDADDADDAAVQRAFREINSSDWRQEYGIYSPSKKKSELRSSKERSGSTNELERPPSPSPSPSSSPRPTSTGGKSRYRRTVKKYKK